MAFSTDSWKRHIMDYGLWFQFMRWFVTIFWWFWCLCHSFRAAAVWCMQRTLLLISYIDTHYTKYAAFCFKFKSFISKGVQSSQSTGVNTDPRCQILLILLLIQNKQVLESACQHHHCCRLYQVLVDRQMKSLQVIIIKIVQQYSRQPSRKCRKSL